MHDTRAYCTWDWQMELLMHGLYNHRYLCTFLTDFWILFSFLPVILIEIFVAIITQRASESQGKYMRETVEKEEDEELDEEGEEETGETLCGACGEYTASDDFWICCDLCQRWFHGTCVKITPARAEHIKQYKCPSCNNKRVRAWNLVRRPGNAAFFPCSATSSEAQSSLLVSCLSFITTTYKPLGYWN